MGKICIVIVVVNIELIRKLLKYACGLQVHARSDSNVIFTFVKRWFQYRVVQNFHQETQDNICLRKNVNVNQYQHTLNLESSCFMFIL